MTILDFRCNVCGTKIKACPIEAIDREVSSCAECGSSVRMRSIVHLLSIGLHGRSLALPDWPVNKRIRGVGLSDWHGYAQRLPARVNYVNTYYHTEPYLDIVAPPAQYKNALDFLISSEVFEHVPPPVSRAFRASFEILKPGGILVLTVPFTNEPDTLEHFPDLHRFEIVKIDDDYVLVNKRKDGTFELHTTLAFHGGPGTTLEMRVFSRASLLKHLAEAGFVDVTVMETDYPEMGIIHKHPWSLPILARKPR
jgi:SAM-dependent methyltransferase